MVRSTVDPSMFYSRYGDVRLIVFVDDCCWRGEPRAAKRLAALFKAKWDADSDDCKYFLNMRIKRGDNGYPSVSQPHYAEQIAKNFGLDNSTRTAPSTPLPPGTSINKTERATTTGEPGKQKRRATKPTEVEIRQAEAMNFARPHDRDAYLRSFDITSEESDALVGKNLTRFKEAWGQLSYLSNADPARFIAHRQHAGPNFRGPAHAALAIGTTSNPIHIRNANLRHPVWANRTGRHAEQNRMLRRRIVRRRTRGTVTNRLRVHDE